MKLKITSITTSEVGAMINAVTTAFEDRLRPLIEPKEYGAGIEQLVIFFVSVDSDLLENERYCVANNRASRYKDFLSGKFVRFIGIAVPVDPVIPLTSSPRVLTKKMEELLLDELKSPAYALPKKFERLRLLEDFKRALLDTRSDSHPH